MNKQLGPGATIIILLIVLGVVGAFFAFAWNRGGKEKWTSLADAQKADRELMKKQGIELPPAGAPAGKKMPGPADFLKKPAASGPRPVGDSKPLTERNGDAGTEP